MSQSKRFTCSDVIAALKLNSGLWIGDCWTVFGHTLRVAIFAGATTSVDLRIACSTTCSSPIKEEVRLKGQLVCRTGFDLSISRDAQSFELVVHTMRDEAWIRGVCPIWAVVGNALAFDLTLSVATETKVDAPATFLQTMYSMQKQDELCDVTFVVGKEAKEFRAHKVVCCARSPVFRRMLQPTTTMVESKTGRVELPEMEPEHFASLLEYMYRGDVYLTADNDEQLMLVADAYQMTDLVRLINAHLARTLSTANFARRFVVLADRLPHMDLRKDMLRWLSVDRVRAIFSSPSSSTLSAEQVKQMALHIL